MNFDWGDERPGLIFVTRRWVIRDGSFNHPGFSVIYADRLTGFSSGFKGGSASLCQTWPFVCHNNKNTKQETSSFISEAASEGSAC